MLFRLSRPLRNVHPELGRYSQATFHDGVHRQAPGDSTPWRDHSSPIMKLRAWWMAPAAKGSIVAAWSCTAVVFAYCWSLQMDAKGTYLMNNVLLRNLHQEAIRADSIQERADNLQQTVQEQVASEKNLRATHTRSITQCNDSKEELRTGLVNYELELSREKARSTLLHDRNQALVKELSSIRIELFQLRRERADLAEQLTKATRLSSD